MFLISVEATSANVCVGFDVLGFSINLFNQFTFEKAEETSFVGFNKKYMSPDTNLVYQSYAEVFKKLNKEIIPVKIGIKTYIPVSRGLGSSSSLIVAGVFGANEMLGKPLSKAELYNLAVQIEGHPDNVGAAIYGNLVSNYKINDTYKKMVYKINDDIRFITVIPTYEISTKKAREVLPKELSYNDIVNNTSRIINLPKAFYDGNLEMLKELFNDTMHEPYRKELIKDYDAVKEIANKYNLPMMISGSGSTMIIISKEGIDNNQIIDDLKKINLTAKIHKTGYGVRVKEQNNE